MITTWYDSYEVKTRIDRVSGIVDALPMVQNTGTIITPPIYTWSTSDYSTCSLACWWWTQTRTVVCHDIKDLVVADSFCDPALKPDSSQSCNTQVCPINGTCGSADSVPSATIPNFWLCASGSWSTPIVNPAVPPAINDYWIWTCSGSNSGSTTNCSAIKQTNYCVAWGVISCIASWAVSSIPTNLPSCSALKSFWISTDWMYSILVNWVQKSVYCDMTTDWWWWTLIMQANKNNSPTTAQWNTTSSVWSYSFDYSTTFKFSDTDINSIGTWQLFRTNFTVNGTGYKRYYKNCTYSHTTKILHVVLLIVILHGMIHVVRQMIFLHDDFGMGLGLGKEMLLQMFDELMDIHGV